MTTHTGKSSLSPQEVMEHGVLRRQDAPYYPCSIYRCRGETRITRHTLLRSEPGAPGLAFTHVCSMVRCLACGDLRTSVLVKVHYNPRRRCGGTHVGTLPPPLDRPGESALCAECRERQKNRWHNKRHHARKWKRDGRIIVARGRASGKVYCATWTKRLGPCTNEVERPGERCGRCVSANA